MSKNATINKLRCLEEKSNQINEDIAIYQNIRVDELCEEYANILVKASKDIDKDNALNLMGSLAKEIYQVYYG